MTNSQSESIRDRLPEHKGFFFVRVGEVCTPTVVTCSPEQDLGSVAALMHRRNVSGVVVAEEGGTPLGMITDRDLRGRLAEEEGDVRSLKASAVMGHPLVTIEPEDYIFEAIYRMARHNVHRLVVVDSQGKLAGILTNTDVMQLQVTSPLYLSREIEAAETIRELRRARHRSVLVLNHACGAGLRAREAVALLSHYSDAITRRAILFLRRSGDLPLDSGFAYLALGSEGRRELTLRSDQDSAVIYSDDLSPADRKAIERFSRRLAETLEEVGVPPCPGGTMASNPAWRRSLTEWKETVRSWISAPDPEGITNFGMFCCLRTLFGDAGLERELEATVLEAVGENALFLAQFARNILRFPPPLGLWGRIKVERSGEHRGLLDLKRGAIFAITEAATLMGLELGVLQGGTREKLALAAEKGFLPLPEVRQLEESFSFLTGLRFRSQLQQAVARVPPTNHVDPRSLDFLERERLRAALGAVAALQRFLRTRYQLDFLAH